MNRASSFHRFLKILKVNTYRKIFVFDLDRTLWDYTVEKSPNISIKTAMTNYIHKDRLKILEAIQMMWLEEND